MATITDYTSLTSAVTEYLARDQDATLIARIPTFIQLAEAKFNRDINHHLMEQRSLTTIDTLVTYPELIALPANFNSMRRMRIVSYPGRPRLEYRSSAGMDEYRALHGDKSGRPLFYSILGGQIELCPNPDANYTIEMVYRLDIPALSLTNPTNWLLTLAPDLYLYGTLLETSPYIKDDARIATWGTGVKAVMDSLNSAEETKAFNAGPIVAQIDGVAP